MNEAIRQVGTKAIVFTATFMLSLILVNALPGARQQRQRRFVQAAGDGSVFKLEMLHSAGADVNAADYCCAPLFLAASHGRVRAVRYLLDQGADLDAPTKFGQTALMEATYSGYLEVMKELLLRGAQINAVGSQGTALDVALAGNNPAAVDLLKHYGARRACEISVCSP